MALNLPHPGLLLTLGGYFGLLFLTYKLKNSAAGIIAVFALTGFMGLTLGGTALAGVSGWVVYRLYLRQRTYEEIEASGMLQGRAIAEGIAVNGVVTAPRAMPEFHARRM